MFTHWNFFPRHELDDFARIYGPSAGFMTASPPAPDGRGGRPQHSRGSGPRAAAGGIGRRAAAIALALLVGAAGCSTSDSSEDQDPAFSAPAREEAAPRTVETPVLTDVAREAGLSFWHENGAFGDKWMPETMGSGGGFFDWDGDGWPDIFLVNSSNWPGHEREEGTPLSALFRNLGDGRFEDVSARAGLDSPAYGMGVAFADFDADGDQDVFFTALGPNRLYENRDGLLVDVAADYGLAGDPEGWSTAAAWIDTNRDGWLDLVVCDYIQWTPETNLHHRFDGVTPGYSTPELYPGATCRLFENEEGRGFSDRTEAGGILNPDGKALGIAVEDLDDDGWPDFVVANDVAPNSLFRNNGDGTFEDIALRAGVAFDEAGRARAGMGIDIGEMATGRLAIAIGNFTSEPVALFSQISPGLFQDRAGAAGLNRPTLLSLTFGLVYADVDRDGHLDLALANGHVEPTINSVGADVTFPQQPSLYLADGEGRFVDASDEVGIDFTNEIVGRGLASSDYDRDGDVDLLVTTNGGPPRLFRNDLAPDDGAWLRVRLSGRSPNLQAVGAVVTLFTGDRQQRRMVRTGGSYLSQSETNPVYFAIPPGLTADSMSVRWPTTGDTQLETALVAGTTITIEEGG